MTINQKNELLQWAGALFVIIGYSLNAVGPASYPYNIASFFIGASMFLLWALRVKNTPQTIVNIIAVSICITGLFKAFNL